tara:strand:- start:581 stop:1489 length:909 start_codon:yes stop_codon:yes gene_type:complete
LNIQLILEIEMMYDVSLYGNLILDTTYCVNDYSHGESNTCLDKKISPGGIANVAAAISRIEPTLNINIESKIGGDISGRYAKKWFANLKKLGYNVNANMIETSKPTSEAIIISDLLNMNRSSIVNWGACQEINKLNDYSSRWCHILYVDKLPNLDLNSLKYLSENSIISIDLCSSNHNDKTREKILSMLPYVDYVFASSEEGRCLIGKEKDYDIALAIAKNARGWAVIHSPDGSFISNGQHKNTKGYKVENKIQKPVNVLGAGDNFAAAFISKKIQDKNTVEESVRFAHEQATKYILNNSKG